ncbi:P63C domain-containing protein [Archangium violaceum]|uniref:P63C domain-containing protein n=1 Tax=Archangium violaceum TaxID=83451 RepID=UPI00193C2867|nr:P63C domain-containing protein [Archangium violaceum]QRK08066.1 P63C domain-containing protein [Archangium violaceum]
MTEQAKDAAKELGERGGKKGGRARAAALSTERRREIAQAAAEARWAKSPGTERTPRATHEGELRIPSGGPDELVIPCFVLNDGRRVLSRAGMISTLGMKGGSNPKQGYDRLTNFSLGKSISPYISEGLAGLIQAPFQFRLPGGGMAFGFEASALVDLCDAILEARAAGVLQTQQQHIARQAEVLVRGFSRVGIVALVDEATGYEAERRRGELHKILEAYIAKELLPWAKRFPDEFYTEMFRLLGWKADPLSQRPVLVGKLTNNLVYERLPEGVLDELKRKNPVVKDGRRRHKHHQFLSVDIGHEHLGKHLAVVCALMRISPDFKTFVRQLDRAVPRYGKNYELPLDDLSNL